MHSTLAKQEFEERERNPPTPLILTCTIVPSGSTHEVREPYTAQQKDELSVTKGDKVTVLSAPDDGWWVVW